MIGLLVGHSYFGKGRIVDIDGDNVVVRFEYTGLKTVNVAQVQVIPLSDQF